MAIDNIIKLINKEYGEGTLKRANTISASYLSTGSLYLDWATGKGFPMGKIVELFGLPSSGKSLISQLTVAQAQKKKMTCIWVDAEKAFDPDFATSLGVDVDKLIVIRPDMGEPLFDLLKSLLTAKDEGDIPDVIVVDSVASIVPRADMEESFDKAMVATRARLMSRGLAVLNTLNKKTLIIFINQLRTNVGAYGAPSVTPGGRSLPHYTSVRVEVRRGDFLEKSKVKYGQIVKFIVMKNKTSQPWREGYFKYYYDGTIDRADEMVSLALLENKIAPSGAWFNILEKKFQGREALEEELKMNPEFNARFIKEIIHG